MHMADALVSPFVGGAMWVVSGASIAWSARRVQRSRREDLAPLMGMLGAFVFAAQMINFSIPGTGSSGHLGGGLLLALLLGPHAALLVIASILTVQALFFADGGLLALGCNIFNLGCIPVLVACPLVHGIAGRHGYGTARSRAAVMVAAIVGLQLGALAVVGETSASGIASLPFGAFAVLMLPIHLAIGVAEGLATAATVSFIARARPEALPASPATTRPGRLRPLLAGLALGAVALGGVGSWFASAHPDGLEWSVAKAGRTPALRAPEAGVRQALASLQEKTAFLPDYGFRSGDGATDPEPSPATGRAGASTSGIMGGTMTLALGCLLGLALRAGSRRRAGG